MSAYNELVGRIEDHVTPSDKTAYLLNEAAAAIRALEGERDALLGDPEGDTWWKVVIGDGAHTPSGEVASIKHMHPLMVKPIYEAHKGTAVADVIAGLLFAKSITENREQFLVKDANERRDEAEAARQSAEAKLEAVRKLIEEAHFECKQGCGGAARWTLEEALASLDKEKAGG